MSYFLPQWDRQISGSVENMTDRHQGQVNTDIGHSYFGKLEIIRKLSLKTTWNKKDGHCTVIYIIIGEDDFCCTNMFCCQSIILFRNSVAKV